MKSFHGLASLYRKFIRNFSHIMAPILNTIKGVKCKFAWTTKADESFEYLKKMVVDLPILRLPDFHKTFTVKCDASNLVIGEVSSQEDHPIAFFTEKLNEAIQRYSTYDLELYAMVQSLKKWRHYLLPKEFIVYTDNHALSFLHNQDKLNQKHHT